MGFVFCFVLFFCTMITQFLNINSLATYLVTEAVRRLDTPASAVSSNGLDSNISPRDTRAGTSQD